MKSCPRCGMFMDDDKLFYHKCGSEKPVAISFSGAAAMPQKIPEPMPATNDNSGTTTILTSLSEDIISPINLLDPEQDREDCEDLALTVVGAQLLGLLFISLALAVLS